MQTIAKCNHVDTVKEQMRQLWVNAGVVAYKVYPTSKGNKVHSLSTKSSWGGKSYVKHIVPFLQVCCGVAAWIAGYAAPTSFACLQNEVQQQGGASSEDDASADSPPAGAADDPRSVGGEGGGAQSHATPQPAGSTPRGAAAAGAGGASGSGHSAHGLQQHDMAMEAKLFINELVKLPSMLPTLQGAAAAGLDDQLVKDYANILVSGKFTASYEWFAKLRLLSQYLVNGLLGHAAAMMREECNKTA